MSAPPPSSLLMDAFSPARDCPNTAADNRAAAIPDLWPDAAKRSCMQEMAPDLAAGVELIGDLFGRVTDAYEAYDISAAIYARFRNASWRQQRDRAFTAEYRRLYDSAVATAATYDAALQALTTALQSYPWVAQLAPTALRRRLGPRTFALAPSPRTAAHALSLAITGSRDRPRALMPDAFAAVPVDVPLPVPPTPMDIVGLAANPMPVFFYGEMKFAGQGVFVTRTAHQLGAAQGSALYGVIQDQVCEISPDLCRKAAAPESAANAPLHLSGDLGPEAAFIAAPDGYSVCRVAVDWGNVAMPRDAAFAARIERTAERDGVTFDATATDARRSANWIAANVLVGFVREDLLASSPCWADGTTAWNCRGRFCSDIKVEARFEMPPRRDRPVVCLRFAGMTCS